MPEVRVHLSLGVEPRGDVLQKRQAQLAGIGELEARHEHEGHLRVALPQVLQDVLGQGAVPDERKPRLRLLQALGLDVVVGTVGQDVQEAAEGLVEAASASCDDSPRTPVAFTTATRLLQQVARRTYCSAMS